MTKVGQALSPANCGAGCLCGAGCQPADRMSSGPPAAGRSVCRAFARILLIPLAALLIAPSLLAQPPGAPQPPRTAQASAPVDFTGYWVSPVMEDWRWRMVTPLKGDFASIPINRAAYDVGQAWDPARDEAAGLACKSYGAPALMRIPGRLHISWQDDSTIKIETDAGTQTRLFHFNARPPANEAPTWQGHSEANWERPVRGEGDPRNDFPPIFSTRTGARGKSLEVMTIHLRAGYLRKNGVPYSEDTRLEEFYDYRTAPDGTPWFTVTTVVHDPKYLVVPFITSTDFKKEADGVGWHPTPCAAR